MSGFPTTFGRDGQSSNQRAASNPISYQANVNRQKTKKWVDAKAVDYGGGWGSDEDDEYGDEDPPPPPPVSKPSGYRQQGQSLQSPQESNSPASDAYKKNYGDLPSRPRANSFDRDDEVRNFSSTNAPATTQQSTTAPPTRFSQMDGVPGSRLPSGQPLSVSTQEGSFPQQQPDGGSRFSSGDYQAKRDYSPTAAPPPLNTFSPSSSNESPSSTRFPARKSSMSQTTGPSLQDANRGRTQEPPTQTVVSPTSQSAAPPVKALPFIRPADIYRRAEEERRQSIESGGRPNVDNLLGRKSEERPESPSKLSNEVNSIGALGGRGNASRDESPGRRHLAPALEPVKERKSEYGFDEYNAPGHAPSHAPKTMITPASIDQQHFTQPPSESVRADAQKSRLQTTSPQLPNLNRMSGFGIDMFSAPSENSSHPPLPQTAVERPNTPLASIGQQSKPIAAKSPDLEKNTRVEPALGNVGSGPAQPASYGKDSSTVDRSVNDDEPFQPPRSLGHEPSVQSFRPELPGGWTSYATIPQVETPQPEPRTHWTSIPAEKLDTDEAYDLTPTTTRHALPQTQSMTDAAEFQSGAPTGEHDSNTMIPPLPSQPKLSADSMPTPDPAMAPSGNLYAATTIDPRLLPKLDQAPVETQLRPDVGTHSTTAGGPDLPPPPPAKDTPEIAGSISSAGESADENKIPAVQAREDYFPTLAQSSVAGQGKEAIVSENDRLEEEIVRSLSPQPRDETRDGLLTPISPNATRESTYLPAEYGDYWADQPESIQTPPTHHEQQTQQSQAQDSIPPTIRRVDSPDQTVAPLSVAKPIPQQSEPLVAERPTVQQRFSWEQSSENVTPADLSQSRALDTPSPRPATLATEPPTSTLTKADIAAEERSRSAYDAAPTPQYELLPPPPQVGEPIATLPDSTSIRRESFEDEKSSNKISAALGGAAALAAGATVAAVTAPNNDNIPQRRASLAEEKATRVSSYPVNVTPPENEHPARSPEPYFGTGAENTTGQQQTSNTVSPITSPLIPPPPATTSRLLAFKEIMNMKTSHERIQTFDDTRHRFAAMDSGLSNWMETLQAQHAEHSNASGIWGTTAAPGVLPKGSKHGLQQPYYQQYLNTSSPTNASPTSAAAQGTPQSFPSGSHSGPSKITTQQVQAKGKELLHTAGIFGGKAGKAGKGLLAKGKSRFRGGDKVSPERPSPEPTSKSESRKSWGFSSSKPKSTGSSPNKSRNASIDNLSAPRLEDNQRSSTMTSVSSQPAILPRTATSGTLNNIDLPGAWPETQAQGSAERQILPATEFVTSIREIRDADQSTTDSSVKDDEDRDKLDDGLAPPRPIGKHQPSWDPFNATPIAEEQLSSHDARPEQKSYPFPAAADQYTTQPSMVQDTLQPTETAVSQSTRIRAPLTEHTSVTEAQGGNPSDGQVNVSTSEIVSPTDLATPMGTSNDYIGRPVAVQRGSVDRSHSYSPDKQMSVARPLDLEGVDKDTHASIEITPQQDSTFLPPIRRTSAFGFKFGSRKTKQRFPLEEDEDDEVDRSLANTSEPDGPAVALPTDQISHESNREGHVPLRRERRSVQNLKQEDSGYSTEKPGLDTESKSIDPLYMPTRLQGSEEAVGARRQSLEEYERLQQIGSRRQSSDTVRPPLIQATSSEYSQRSSGSDVLNSGHRSINNGTPIAVARTSQDAWRPNVVATGISSPPPQDIPLPTFGPRQSWEGQRPRANSGSSYNIAPRPEVLSSERQWSPAPAVPFAQPPSAAQRYPNLFRSAPHNVEPIDRDNADLPAHYYQQPLPREAALLPRQQTNEYQLPGVGPDEYRRSPRRNSSLLRDIGGRISRATSRERRQSISRDAEIQSRQSQNDSRADDDDTDSGVISIENAEKKKRRSSFFRSSNRSSTNTPDAPNRQDSKTVLPPASTFVHRESSTASSPFNGPTTSAPAESRTIPANGNVFENKHKANKLSNSTINSTPEQTPMKKKRFSGLSGFFAPKQGSRNSTPDHPQPTKQLSSDQRQPLESAPVSRTPTRIHDPSRESTSSPSRFQQDARIQQSGDGTSGSPLDGRLGDNTVSSPLQGPIESQTRRLQAGDRDRRSVSQPIEQKQKPRKASKTRRSSGAGLFSGLLGRKKSYQDENLRDSAQHNNAQQTFMTPARRESGTPISGQQGDYRSSANSHQNSSALEQRGRTTDREPQYDTVPIPGGYSLVRAQAGQSVPTDYNPRGSKLYEQGPRYSQEYQIQAPSYGYQQPQQSSNQYQTPGPSQPTPALALQTQNLAQNSPHVSSQANPQDFGRAPTRPLSAEDVIARSPALTSAGQQRPYQLSLPDEDVDRMAQVERTSASPHGNQANSHISSVTALEGGPHKAVLRLQPEIRHPESPSAYPLPVDTAFSPVVREASDLPPPPPPKDMQRGGLAMDHSRQVSRSSLLTGLDLNRSGTHRTAVSAISGISDPPTHSPGGFSNRRASLDRSNNVVGRKTSTGPPSPLETSRVASPALSQGNDVKTTVLEAPKRQSLDLYDASPLVSTHNVASPPIPPQSIHRRTSSRPETPKLSLQTPSSRSSSSRYQQTPQAATKDSRYAELEGTKADGFNMRVPRREQEEKIFYDKDSGMRGAYGRDEDDYAGPSMSATSYPGQEWNPYGAGGWDDDSDVGVGSNVGRR